MNRPPTPRMNNYHRPLPYGYQWRPRGRGYSPHTGSQSKGNMPISPCIMNAINENGQEFWCETCDRGFASADILDKHKQQHQKCNIDGCQFVAHPKVITKHIQMQHSSGLYKKIPKLNNPEDIQKWREERKKKYPTRINIEKKAAEFKEKIERGEKMALKQDKYRNNKSTPHLQNPDQNRKRRHDFDKNKQSPRGNLRQRQNTFSSKRDGRPVIKASKINPKIVPSIIKKNKLRAFTGISGIVMDDIEVNDVSKALDNNDTLIEDDCYEGPLTSTAEKSPQEPAVCGALTLLMCDYGSSEDEANEIENKIIGNATTIKPLESLNCDNVKKHCDAVNLKKKIDIVCCDKMEDIPQAIIESKEINDKVNSDDDSGPEEVKTVKNNVEASIPEAPINTNEHAFKPKKQHVQTRNDQRHNNKYRHKVPSTLLHKLLHKEIRQERNIVLQCIRYIKMMNYFTKAA